MKQKRTALRKLVLRALVMNGGFQLWHFLNRGKITILELHSVLDQLAGRCWEPLRESLAVERLEFGLRVLSKHYSFVSMNEVVDILTGRKKAPNHAMALTFDDGYHNNIAYALPILEKYSIPMIVYLSTDYVGSGKAFWFDRLDFALQNGRVGVRDLELKGRLVTFFGTDRKSLKKSFKELRDIAKKYCTEGEELENAMNNLANQLENENGERIAQLSKSANCLRLLEWNEIRTCVGRGVHFGSHTVDHVRLGYVKDENEIRRQVGESKAVIEKETGRACHHLCYPNGSFNSLTMRIAKECGYSSAVGSEPGLNGKGADLMSLCRLPFPDSDNEGEILYVASGLSEALSRIKEKARKVYRKH